MNEAAKIISESLSGTNFKTVLLAGKAYTIYPPTIKIVVRALGPLSKVDINEKQSELSIIGEIPSNAPHIIKGISAFIVGDVNNWRWKAHRLGKQLEKATPKELNEAFKAIIELIQGKDFFDCAAYVQNVVKMAANQR
ncbi:hypothetical protein [uncultured Bacteroides sp.]|uniref:hypothetical protein n=1 Tax=uncultured Bacteroides sp. TaxID=162156 RepID=UPI002AAC3488|nr:hypothetical protein [uncultured Bacteroides sp.]